MDTIINYEQLSQQINDLPIELIEKIRRQTYKPQPNELLNDIISYSALKYVLNKTCDRKNLGNYCIVSLIKFLDENNQIVPYKYSNVCNIIRRNYKYRGYKQFLLLDKIQEIKLFGIFWGILQTKERINIIRYIHENY
jgi:hypothetical protein